MGQSIAQMEKFERGDISDEEDDEEDVNRGKLSGKIQLKTPKSPPQKKITIKYLWSYQADLVSENFFGGFKQKSEQDSKKTRQDWIEEMIAKSKQAKVGILTF